MRRSKAFRFELGHISSETPTVGDLIAFLSDYPTDMPVMAEWESQVKRIGSHRIKNGYHEGMAEDAADVLIIDVEF